jgi:tRNA(adenine34) deaminase
VNNALLSGMAYALAEANQVTSDIPVGAVILDNDGSCIFKDRNRRESKNTLLGHAECLVIEQAWKSFSKTKLAGLTLVSTLEPCLVCASLIRETRLARVVFGASNAVGGAGGSVYDILRDARLGPPPEVIGGIRAAESEELLRDFFQRLRNRD